MLSRSICAIPFLTLTTFLSGCTPATDVTDVTVSAPTRVTVLEQASEQIKVKMAIIDNGVLAACEGDSAGCYTATLSLQLAPQMPTDWRIVFSHLSPISEASSDYFDLVHTNGDLHQITLKENASVDAEQTYVIHFKGNTPLVSESVLFPNYLLIDGDGEAHVIASTKEQLLPGHQLPRPAHIEPFTDRSQQLRGANDNVPIASASQRFKSNQAKFGDAVSAFVQAQQPRVIPQLNSAEWTGSQLDIAAGLKLPNIAINLEPIKQRFEQVGVPLNDQGLPIKLVENNSLNDEAYQLNIAADSIDVVYAKQSGLFHALYTIAQLFDTSTSSLPVGQVADQPAMPFRGLHLDVSRNFRDKSFVLELLDQMAYYKLNKLHFHLADDEGWRLEIPSLPELTEVGAHRCVDDTERNCLLPQLAGGDGKSADVMKNSGYYSKVDYLEILAYAKARHIEVIPSLDMPGHSRAAIVSMQARHTKYMLKEDPETANAYYLTEPEDNSQYRSIQHYSDNTLNPCIPATYLFVQEVLNQLIAMHEEADVKLNRYHIGADETAGAWQGSPACAELIESNEKLNTVKDLGPYFIERVAAMVNDLEIIPAAWSDGLSYANPDNLPAVVQSNVWGTLYSGAHNDIHKMINRGWDVVLSVPDVLYFDFPYEADPVEPGYYWGSRNTDTYQVFQFMPYNLPVHAEIWHDNLGNDYIAKQAVSLADNRAVIGMQAQLWSETVRSNAQANYMLYPRLLAVAERAWHTPAWTEAYQAAVDYSADSGHFDQTQRQQMRDDWLSFSNKLTQQAMPQLIKDGVIPRVPMPGAVIEQGKLYMNAGFVGLILEYRTQHQEWQPYTNPVPVKSGDAIEVRARIPSSNISSRVQRVDTIIKSKPVASN